MFCLFLFLFWSQVADVIVPNSKTRATKRHHHQPAHHRKTIIIHHQTRPPPSSSSSSTRRPAITNRRRSSSVNPASRWMPKSNGIAWSWAKRSSWRTRCARRRNRVRPPRRPRRPRPGNAKRWRKSKTKNLRYFPCSKPVL